MGWVTKTPEGTWKAGYRDPSGRIRYRTMKRKADATAFLAKVESEKHDGSYLDPSLGRMRFSAYWVRFLEASPHLRPSTRRLYEMLATRYLLPVLGPKPLNAISPLDVRTLLAKLERSGTGAATSAAAFRLLRRVLNTALEGGFIGRNPTLGIKAPRSGSEEMRFLSAPQVQRLAEEMQPRYRALVYLLGYGGLRIGEAAGLRIEHLDLLRGRAQIVQALSEVGGKIHLGPTKTRARRTVSLPPFLRRMLSEHIHAFPSTDGYVFSAPEGGPIRHRNFRARAWDPAAKAAGLAPLRIHDMRHTCAALLIEQRAHVKEIADRLGHSSPVVTMTTYAHLLPSLDEKLADGLESAFQKAAAGSASFLLPVSEIEAQHEGDGNGA